jgi:hypothetical protein
LKIAECLSRFGGQGVRLAIAANGGLSTKIPTHLPVEEVRAFLRDNRDEILAIVADLDCRLAVALRTLDGVERKASRPATLVVAAMYRDLVVQLRERLDPIAGEVDEAARLFASQVRPA